MTVQDVEVDVKRYATITFTIMDKVLMIMREVDVSLIPSLIPTIINVILVDHWVFIVMVMIELYIGIITNNFIHINMFKYTLTRKVFLMKISQGV